MYMYSYVCELLYPFADINLLNQVGTNKINK